MYCLSFALCEGDLLPPHPLHIGLLISLFVFTHRPLSLRAVLVAVCLPPQAPRWAPVDTVSMAFAPALMPRSSLWTCDAQPCVFSARSQRLPHKYVKSPLLLPLQLLRSCSHQGEGGGLSAFTALLTSAPPLRDFVHSIMGELLRVGVVLIESS
jgi:hypothetical protein